MNKRLLVLPILVATLFACNKNSTLKEISKEQALDRATNYNSADVIDHCGEYVIAEYKVSFSNKYGMFKNFTDEQIYGEVTGKDTHIVEEETGWLVISAGDINSYDDEITWFYASGKSGLKIRFKYTEEDILFPIHATDTEYHFDAAIDETYTIGNYGQLTKYTATYRYNLLTSYYPDVPDSGFTVHWKETYTYTNNVK